MTEFYDRDGWIGDGSFSDQILRKAKNEHCQRFLPLFFYVVSVHI